MLDGVTANQTVFTYVVVAMTMEAILLLLLFAAKHSSCVVRRTGRGFPMRKLEKRKGVDLWRVTKPPWLVTPVSPINSFADLDSSDEFDWPKQIVTPAVCSKRWPTKNTPHGHETNGRLRSDEQNKNSYSHIQFMHVNTMLILIKR